MISGEYNQQIGENYEEWQYRILLGKANKQVDLSWEEIRQLLNLDEKAMFLSKIAYGINNYRQYITNKSQSSMTDEEATASLEILDDLRSEQEYVAREKMRLADQKREYMNLQRQSARSEHIIEEIRHAATLMAASKPLPKATIPSSEGKEREGALLLSDWHAGARCSNYWNEFNDVELMKRVEKVVARTIQYGQEQKVGKLHVFLLGDLINGLIHITTRINNTENVIAQTQLVAELLSQELAKLAGAFPEVIVYTARGNHDRVSANVKESIAEESFFDFIPWYLKARLADISNIKLVDNIIDSEIISTEICGQTIFAVHGHRDKLKSVVANLSQMLKIFPDYIFLGHYHHHEEAEEHGCEVVVNSSLSGVDDFAKEIRKTGKAAQKFIVFDKEEGRLCTYNIQLG